MVHTSDHKMQKFAVQNIKLVHQKYEANSLDDNDLEDISLHKVYQHVALS